MKQKAKQKRLEKRIKGWEQSVKEAGRLPSSVRELHKPGSTKAY